MDVVLWDMYPACKVTRDAQELLQQLHHQLLQQLQHQLQQTRKQLRQPKEQLEDKRRQRWENEKAGRMGSMLKVSLAFSILP